MARRSDRNEYSTTTLQPEYQPENQDQTKNEDPFKHIQSDWTYRLRREKSQHAFIDQLRLSENDAGRLNEGTGDLTGERQNSYQSTLSWEPTARALVSHDPETRAQAEHQMLLNLAHTPATQDLVAHARRGEFPPDVMDKFFHQNGAKVEFIPDSEEPIKYQLANFANRLQENIHNARHDTLSHIPWSLGTENPAATEASLEAAAYRRAKELIIENSPWDPQAKLDHPNPAVNQAWENHHGQTAELSNNRLTELPFRLQIRHDEAAGYKNTGQLPDYIDESKLTKEATTVSPELETIGYSTVHNQPIDIFDKPENIEKYLRRQMDAHLNHQNHLTLNVHPADFGRALLKPELDPILGAKWQAKFDLDNFYYTDDGPINFQEEHHILTLTDDTTNPLHHLQASYGRLVRDSLMTRGIADDAYMHRPEALAMSYPRNVLALRRLAETGHQMLAQHQEGTWQDPEMPGYQPVLQWTSTPEQILDAIDPNDPFATDQTCKRMLASLEGHFQIEDTVDHDSPLRLYSFIPQPDDPGQRDVDHPSAILLREAVSDISQAMFHLAEERKNEVLDQLELAIEQGDGQAFLDNLRDQGEHWLITDEAQRIVESRYSRQDEDQYQTLMRELRHEDNPADEQDQNRTYAMIADRLAHADFCIKLAKHARG